MVIDSPHNSKHEVVKLNVEDTSIEETDTGKILGITFDNKLSMCNHITNICKQASKKLYALARISHYLNNNQKRILMKSFITSQFNYCPIIWMYCQRRSNNLINRIHERALRIAYNDYVSDFHSLLLMDNSVTIHQRNIQTLILEVYKTMHGINPDFMNEVFTLRKHNYSTREQHLIYPKPHTVAFGLETFGYKAGQLWSKIPQEIKNIKTISDFKRQVSAHIQNICKCNLCKTYIQNLGYIEVSTIHPTS